MPMLRQSRALIFLATTFVLLLASVFSPVSASAQTARVVPESLRIRAIGDAVTAGVGVGGNEAWASQVARIFSSPDYQNLAVAGSTTGSWMDLPVEEGSQDGQNFSTVRKIVTEDPDFVFMTMGGSMLLRLPLGPALGCQSFKDQKTQSDLFAQCVDGLVKEGLIQQRVMAVSFSLLARTVNTKVVIAGYVPPSPTVSFLSQWQIELLTQKINTELQKAVTAVGESGATWAERIAYVPPPNTTNCAASSYGILRVDPKRASENCPLRDPRFVVGSNGTLPGLQLQTELAQNAVSIIRAKGWMD
ncbi:MAG: hypothetical protein RLZZ31_2012 [Actinomycetota bacterium]